MFAEKCKHQETWDGNRETFIPPNSHVNGWSGVYKVLQVSLANVKLQKWCPQYSPQWLVRSRRVPPPWLPHGCVCLGRKIPQDTSSQIVNSDQPLTRKYILPRIPNNPTLGPGILSRLYFCTCKHQKLTPVDCINTCIGFSPKSFQKNHFFVGILSSEYHATCLIEP